MNFTNANTQNVIYEINITENKNSVSSYIEKALVEAQDEILAINETISTVHTLRADCDKLDYALAVSSGVICGIIDIFLVGKPGNTPIGNVTDKWFEDRTRDFAKLCGWNGSNEKDTSSAISFLEQKFKIPYDQSTPGGAARMRFDLTPTNHHFKSLAHNPSLLGLFFSILDQFANTSHFISDGDLISLQNASGTFELKGKSIPGKLFCAFANWFGHLISDVSGSSRSVGRGMGIPSPLWTWTNDIIAIKRKLNIPASHFDKALNDLSLELFKKGYDVRFQTAQAIPVLINELMVRLIYSTRRLIKYFNNYDSQKHSFTNLWKACEPFTNPTVQRMLTVAHGTFLVIDSGEAVIQSFIAGGGAFNPIEFFMRLNIIGVGRFTISIYGEVKRGIRVHGIEREILFARREKIVIENYITGLQTLSDTYNDMELVNFDLDLCSGAYTTAFNKTVCLSEKRNVAQGNIVKNKAEIDNYFKGRK